MKLINYISSAAMPMVILIILLYGLKEKKQVFDLFLDGAKNGIKIVFKIFPTLVGLFVAIGALRSSGVIDMIINIIMPILKVLNIPSEIMPLAMLRPISGSASMAVATDIMKNFGVDSNIRNFSICNNGINRNYIIYNSCLCKFCRNKKY